MTERTGAGGTKSSLLRYFKLFAAIGLVFVAIPTSASAQATRTFVSGVGDDANPCSRTAPCKTFAGAISKTARGGIINCLDPGGFGAVTITKSITLSCKHTHGGILSSGVNGINVNITDPADVAKSVVLRGISIEGQGTVLGVNGVNILSARRVKIYDSSISFYSRSGINVQSTFPGTKVLANDVEIEDVTGNGVWMAPPAAGTGARMTIRNSTIASNGCGVVVTSEAISGATSVDCGSPNGAATGAGSVNVYRSAVVDNDTTAGATGSAGIYTNGNAAVIRIGGNDISGNNFGLRAVDPGASAGIISAGDNYIFGNTTNGTPNFTFPPTRR